MFECFLFANLIPIHSQLSCSIPCTRTTYKFSTKVTHLTNWIDIDGRFPDSIFENSSSAAIRFDSMLIGEEVETYVYDFGNFVVALGGNLGLMLGFSCLSVLFSIIQFISKKAEFSVAINS
jgi:hypothetical protein